MGLDIWLGWLGKPKPQATDTASENEAVDSLRFTYDRPRFSPLSQTFETWAQTQLGGKGIYWILDLDETKLVQVDQREDGSPIRGMHADWPQCQQRVTEALTMAKAIPDRLFVVKANQLRKPLDDYPATWEVLDYYRAERDRRKNQPKVICRPPYLVLEDFKTTAGVFFGDVLPRIKASVLCRGATCIELLYLCEGDEQIHQPYIQALEDIQKFIALGSAHQAWICWSG